MESLCFITFWTLAFCGIMIAFSFDVGLNNAQRLFLSGLITSISLLLVFVIGVLWDDSTEPHFDNIATITELVVSDVILPDGNFMKVVTGNDGRTTPINSIINYEFTENIKFYQVVTKGRFSGITFVPSSRRIITDSILIKTKDIEQ